MTRERIEDFREIVLPFVKKRLLETNYEGLGESDAEMFAKDFNEILGLAIKALEQEPVLDKIRAEIEQTFFDDCAMQEHTVKECLRIIDKYKGESEG